MNPQAASFISLAQWVPVLHRWLGLRHALVVGHSQQADSLLRGDPQALTLFKGGSPVATPAASPAAHAQASYAAAHTLPWLIAEHTGTTTFHQANLPSENGLLPAASLTACWPGIKPLGQHQASALSLDDACAQASAEFAWASPPQWLWIGCLPATALLRGATRLLQQTDVVALRVQLHPEAHPDSNLHGAQSLLETHGFALCGVEPERNPHLGTALFVRDYPAAHSATRQQRDQLSQFHGEMQARLSAETQAKEVEAAAKAEAQRQREELAQAHAEMQARLRAETQAKEAEAAAKAEAQRQNYELTQAHAELQARLRAETQSKEAEAAAKAIAQRQRDELAQAHAKLQEHLSADTQAKQAEAESRVAAQHQVQSLTQATEQVLAQKEALLQEITSLQQAHAQQSEALCSQVESLNFQVNTLESQAKDLSQQLVQSQQLKSNTQNEFLRFKTRIEDLFTTTEAQIDLIKELVMVEHTSLAAEAIDRDWASDSDVHAFSGPDQEVGVNGDIDKNLLQRTITQWQFGDWYSLSQLNRDAIQYHPDRAKLALLGGTGRLQTGQIDEGKQYIRLAKDWGVSKNMLTRILAACVHYSLGRAAAIAGEQDLAIQHFQSALSTGTPGSEARLFVQARTSYQYQQLDPPPVPIEALPDAGPVNSKTTEKSTFI